MPVRTIPFGSRLRMLIGIAAMAAAAAAATAGEHDAVGAGLSPPAAADDPAAADTRQKTIMAIRIGTRSFLEERVAFSLDGVPPPKMLLIEGDPIRLVCDFIGARIDSGVARDIEVRGHLIQRVRIGVHDDPEEKVRVVVDLAPGRDYEIDEYFHPQDSGYELFIRPAGGTAPMPGD